MIPPKPAARSGPVSRWRYLRLFRDDILSAQPAKLYRAKMAEFRAPFLRSVLINTPELVREVLIERPGDFPKSPRVTAGLRRLLGNSVFVTNAKTWARQRRIVEQCFGAGELRRVFPAMLDAAAEAAGRLPDGEIDVEPETSRAAADVIFRTLFSLPIDEPTATATYAAFRSYARTQPLLTPRAFAFFLPAFHRRETRLAAAKVRGLIGRLVADRAAAIAAGTAPDDLATRLMTATDPETGQTLPEGEAADQVAIFFLAGHETSAAALAWALWLVADDEGLQSRIAADWRGFSSERSFQGLSKLPTARDVFREALRLYPPVPMMVRETTRRETFRGRALPKGTQVVISPWHIHRHEAYWEAPDAFDLSRWADKPLREHYLPFSAGPRVCPGASFALAEGVACLSEIVARHRVARRAVPVPVAQLTTRSRDGIRLAFSPRPGA
ncbi:MAG: cytochrome P450 [Paracoccaceae bacterium]|nr:cytochrome P450 [Paracoccaceae bacterium]